MLIHNLVATGSISYNGVNISYVTGSQTSLDGLNQFSASVNTTTGSLNSTTGSLNTATGSLFTASGSFSTRVTNIEGNYATTGSNVFLGAQTVCANITSTGTIIAQTLNVQQVTSSIVYSSGSNIFGCLPSDVQQMTGSLRVTGSGVHYIQGGCVGIGTTSPNYDLHIQNSSIPRIQLTNTVTGTTTGDGLHIYQSGGDSYFINKETSSLFLGTNNLVDMTITGSRVGIGTPTPAFSLDVSGSTSNSNGGTVRIFAGASDASLRFGTTGSYSWIQAHNSKPLYINEIGNNTILNLTSGNVGIGTASPSASLDTTVNSSGGNLLNSTADVVARFGNCNNNPGNHYASGIQVFQGAGTLGSGYAAGFLTADNNTATTQQCNTVTLWSPSGMTGGINLYAADAAGNIKLFTGGTASGCERMRITSGGYIGIGETNPSTYGLLTVNTGTSNNTVPLFTLGYGTTLSNLILRNNYTRANGILNGIEFRDSSNEVQASIYANPTGTNNQSNLIFGTNNGTGGNGLTGATERMRITSGGNVAIGVNTAGQQLVVSGSGADTRVEIGSTTTQGIYFTKNGANNGTFRSNTSGDFEFYTKTVAQAVVISSAGNARIGSSTATPTELLEVSSTAGGGSTHYTLFLYNTRSGGQATGDYYIRFYSNTTNGSVRANGTGGVDFNTTSDCRLKIDPQDFDALSIVDRIRPRNFKWKDYNVRSEGFYAQELYCVYPQAVSVGTDELTADGKLINPWQVDNSKLIPLLTKAIQEQQCKINILESCLGIN